MGMPTAHLPLAISEGVFSVWLTLEVSLCRMRLHFKNLYMSEQQKILPSIEQDILDREIPVVRQEFRVAAMAHEHGVEEEKIFAISGNQNFEPYFRFFFPRGESGLQYAVPNPSRLSDVYEDLKNPNKKFGERILGDMLTEVIADGGAGSHVEELILRKILVLYRKQPISN